MSKPFPVSGRVLGNHRTEETVQHDRVAPQHIGQESDGYRSNFDGAVTGLAGEAKRLDPRHFHTTGRTAHCRNRT